MRFRCSRPVWLQTALTAAAIGIAALVPPAHGAVLLLPLGADQPTAIRVAVAHGARLLGPAPGGALLVWVDGDVAGSLLAAGVLPLAAPFVSCGAIR